MSTFRWFKDENGNVLNERYITDITVQNVGGNYVALADYVKGTTAQTVELQSGSYASQAAAQSALYKLLNSPLDIDDF